MYCKTCGIKLGQKDDTFRNVLSISEQERLVKLNINTGVCRNCQTDILLLTIL